KIYDMLGKEVKTLVEGEQSAGIHNISWDGANNYGVKVSSGTYIYRIQAGEFVQAKKMLLVK
ncbi:MAG: T9SS type A sorting domain-containing protein, partial [Bacteroidetes bacterium]|nr:T9SS type A sorting domain-containing protein [Bacteroidota bacterium]